MCGGAVCGGGADVVEETCQGPGFEEEVGRGLMQPGGEVLGDDGVAWREEVSLLGIMMQEEEEEEEEKKGEGEADRSYIRGDCDYTSLAVREL